MAPAAHARSGRARLALPRVRREGARVGVELPFGDTFFLRGTLDGLFVLNRVSLRVDGAELWSTPAFVSTLGLGAGVRL